MAREGAPRPPFADTVAPDEVFAPYEPPFIPYDGELMSGGSSYDGSVQSVMVVPQKPRRKGVVTLLLSLLVMFASFALSAIAIIIPRAVGLDGYVDESLYPEFCLAVGAVLGVLVLGGKDSLRPNKDAFVYALKQGWWAIAVSFGLLVFDVVATILDGGFKVADGWALRLLVAAATYLCVGIYEEAVFRGLFLGGILDVSGKSRRGIVLAVVLTSLLFGMAHIDWGDLNYADPLSLVQGVLKTLQTGVYGVFLASLIVRTNNLTGAMFIHGLDDFLLLIPLTLEGSEYELEYVAQSSTADAWATIIIYAVVIVLYIPLLVRAIRSLRVETVPNQGIFHK